MPQLQAVLRFPQSVGIVGGRPSSSLYFVGYQGDSVIYLDPHDMQPVGGSSKLLAALALFQADVGRLHWHAAATAVAYLVSP